MSNRQKNRSKNPGAENLKFQNACAKIQESVNKYCNENLNDFESSEEEELEERKILQSVLNSYDESNQNSNFQKTHQALLDSVKSGANVCLICIASVKRQDAVWSCNCCYSLFHLNCIQKWAKDSVFHQSSNDNHSQVDFSSLEWCCPKCRKEYKQFEAPSTYFCYCGKVKNPVFDPWSIPHSCSQQCSKSLDPKCGHFCLLLCHPGPCPPCPSTVTSSCFCGQEKPVTRRCSNKLWSCNKACNRLLACKQHRCSEICHKGECMPCSKESRQRCICGKVSKNVPCSSLTWQCDSPCDKLLDCNVHKCTEICHDQQNCFKCPNSGPRSCPCSKSSYILPCTEDVNPCGDTCSRPLSCKKHYCSQRCHFGECGNCLEVVSKYCRCGLKSKSLPCHRDYTCETKCKNVRDCGRHPCNKKCCLGQCPPCEQPCGRMLRCRNHKCSSVCHRGPCYPCNLTFDIKCKCGKTAITVPCGREKFTRPPKCRKPCMTKPECHHPFRAPHPCHFGDCPPCSQICLKDIPNCDHKCQSSCHTAVLTKIYDPNQKRAGPWEVKAAPVMKIVNLPCPPCVKPVPVSCIGQHQTDNFPCSEARNYPCGRQCGRKLKCGNHSCSMECHEVNDSPDNEKAGSNCEECSHDCEKERPEGCTHKCIQSCHPYNCPPCKRSIKMKCHCTLTQLYITCKDWNSKELTVHTREEMVSCKDQCPKQLQCKHRCQKICHSDNCTNESECSKKVTLRCPCKRIKKEVPCHDKNKLDYRLTCDDYCQKKMEENELKNQETQKIIKEEEERKQKEELDSFQRRFEGKKRKPRKVKEVIEEESFWKTKQFAVVSSLCAITFSCFLYYLLSL